MKRLILNQIPENFNYETDVVICVASYLGKEEKLDMNSVNCFETYHSYKNKKEAAEEATAIAYMQLPFLMKYFNEKYKLNEDELFWKTIVFPWLLTLIHIMLDRYYRVHFFIEHNRGESFSVELLDKENKIQIIESDDLYELVQSHDFNHWLYSVFVEKMAPSSWKKSTIKKSICLTKISKPTKLSIKNKISNWIKKKLRVSYVYGFSAIDCFRFTIKLWTLPRKNNVQRNLEKPRSKTHNYPEFFNTNDFKKLFLEFEPKEFSKIPELMKERMYLCRGKIRLLGPIFYSNLYYKVLAARAAKTGEIVLTTQHGGGYGLYKVIDFPCELETQFHGFISWGWSSDNCFPGNVIPLSSPFLSGVENSYSKKNNDIILVGTRCNPYSDRIEFSFEPSNMLKYRDLKKRFIHALSREKKENFYYRPYPQSVGYFEDFAFQKKHYMDLKLLDGNFHRKIKECGLLVLDHIQTTFNLALAANIPVVCLLVSEDWEFAESAINSMNELKNVGVIYSDPDELALFVNNENVEKWWSSEKVQSARKSWLYTHGRVSSNWKNEWLHFLNTL